MASSESFRALWQSRMFALTLRQSFLIYCFTFYASIFPLLSLSKPVRSKAKHVHLVSATFVGSWYLPILLLFIKKDFSLQFLCWCEKQSYRYCLTLKARLIYILSWRRYFPSFHDVFKLQTPLPYLVCEENFRLKGVVKIGNQLIKIQS